MKNITSSYDYRESHIGKGKEYSRSFSENPHRSMIWHLEQGILDQIVKQYCVGATTRHLDFACGTGRILEYLEKFENISSVGVDISPSMLDIARQRTKRSEIIEGDITRSDVLGDCKFGLITAFRFFPNAQYDLRRDAISVLVSHLERDGVLIFNNHKNLSSSINCFKRLFGRGFKKGMTLQDVETLVNAAGLYIDNIYYVGVIPSTKRYSLLPVKVLGVLEHALSGYPFLRKLALNQIFACRRP